MVNVSKKELDEAVFKEIITQLSVFIARARKRSDAASLLYDLLSPKERIQIAKRLACLVMLEKNVAPTVIAQLLKISPTTLAKYQVELESGKYSTLVKQLKKKDYDESFMGVLEKILQAGLPLRGRGRWERFFEE